MVTRPSRNVRQLPVAPGILQKLESAFLLESQSTVLDNASEKLTSPKGKAKMAVNTASGFVLRSFRILFPLNSGADLGIAQEGKIPAMPSPCPLLLPAVLSLVHPCLFFLILLSIFANLMYQKTQGSSRQNEIISARLSNFQIKTSKSETIIV